MVLMARSMAKKTLISRISENSDASNASTHVRWCRMFFLPWFYPCEQVSHFVPHMARRCAVALRFV